MRLLFVFVALLATSPDAHAQCSAPYQPYYYYSPPVYYSHPTYQPVVRAESPVVRADSPAKVVVLLPPDAELFCDDKSCGKKEETRREFNTPALKHGTSYYYVMRVEVNDGKVTKSKRVYVKAGETTTVDLRFPPPKVVDKEKSVSITVKLLPNTELFYKAKTDADWTSLGDKGTSRNFSVQHTGGDEDEVLLKAVTKGPPKIERIATVKYRGGDEREVDLSYEEKK